MAELNYDDFRGYFNEDDSGMHVVTDSLPRLKLKDELSPEEAPLYIDLETGRGVYPEGLDPEDAYEAASYALDKAGSDAAVHISQDTEAWQEEFSEIVGEDIELGPSWHLNLDKEERKASARR
ncbi:hypothetical protein [Candidatus Nanohalovita haloferacivicina]|uniref:hypothetical protein n=1 Tax=Candidatus Nanohalovita haloferacivicina TaxID=2978046 RepID=UPI00325FADDA|nr:hypothetical protein HBNXNv_0212 [Candidatus Nanohalobia archaeon BNXNv]